MNAELLKIKIKEHVPQYFQDRSLNANTGFVVGYIQSCIDSLHPFSHNDLIALVKEIETEKPKRFSKKELDILINEFVY
jgi:hypothetical protein